MRNDYDELETYNHNNDDYNEYGGHREMTMTYDDVDAVRACYNRTFWIFCI